MKTTELLNKLNETVQPLAGTRVNDFGKFHSSINELIDPITSPLQLEYVTWRIYSEYNHDLFRLDIDFKDDKRARDRRGRLIKLWFTPLVEGETLEQMIKNCRRDKLVKQIEEMDQAIAIRQEDIQRFTEFRDKYTRELQAI